MSYSKKQYQVIHICTVKPNQTQNKTQSCINQLKIKPKICFILTCKTKHPSIPNSKAGIKEDMLIQVLLYNMVSRKLGKKL